MRVRIGDAASLNMTTTISAEAASVYRSAFIVDMMVPVAPGETLQLEDFRSLVEGYIGAGIGWASFTVATDTPASVEATVFSIARARGFFTASPDAFELIESAADLDHAKALGKLAVSLNFQGTNPFAGRLDLIEAYRRLGVLHALLCYNEKNAIADGCYERTDAGLSRYGVRVIKEMNRVGMIVDVSHTGLRSSLEAIDASCRPVIMSHSNARALVDHPRNITDAQIKAIAHSDGVVGIAGINAMTTGSEDVNSVSPQALFRHIDYVAQLVGPRHVGFGLDYITDTASLVRHIKARPDTFPADQHWTCMRSAGPTVIAPIVDLMLKAGYGEPDIRGVLGENWIRVLRDTGPAGTTAVH